MDPKLSPLESGSGDLTRFVTALAGTAGGWSVEEIVLGALEAGAATRSTAERRIACFRAAVALNRRRALAAPAHRSEGEPPFRRAEDLARLVDRLPLDEKEALLLTLLARFSYLGGARVLEIDEGQFADRVMRARARLHCGQPVAPSRRPPYLRVVK
jgi:DNA-directed RNA polymerase specialized sigma24 family protein